MFQEFIALNGRGAGGVRVQRGDSVSVTCQYNTEQRNTPVPGGDKATDEMCVGYFAFYPRAPSVGACLSYNHSRTEASAYCPPLQPDVRFPLRGYVPRPMPSACVASPVNTTRSYLPQRRKLSLNATRDEVAEAFNVSRYDHAIWLDEPARRYRLWWAIDSVAGTISLAAEVATAGW